jgi:hypothetical protein
MKHYSPDKPTKCPECGSSRIITYLYGEAAYSEEMMEDITSGKVILGGFCITGYDPDWECLDCKAEIFRQGKEEN